MDDAWLYSVYVQHSTQLMGTQLPIQIHRCFYRSKSRRRANSKRKAPNDA